MAMAYAAIGLSGQMTTKDGGWARTEESDALAFSVVDDLVLADTPAKLRAFAAEWFPLLEYGLPTDGSGFEETVRLVSDTRDLMLLVLELRRMAEEGDCERGAFERVGVKFEETADGSCENATVYYLSSSKMLADYIRVTCRCADFECFFIDQIRERNVDPMLLEEWGGADDRWKLLPKTTFSVSRIMRSATGERGRFILSGSLNFVKVRFQGAGALALDAKAYICLGAARL